jgi:hypothetical protein
MSREGIGREGIIVLVFTALTAVSFGIDWLIEGRISKEFGYPVLSLWGLLIFTSLMERLDKIRERNEETKEQIEGFEKRIAALEKIVRKI